MRTKAGRPCRGGTLGGRLRLLAASFFPALIAVSAASAPSVSASPTPTRSAPSTVRLLVPEGTTPDTYQQFAEYAQQLFDDPIGHALLTEIYSFRFGGARPNSDPGNVSVEWFDFSWLPPSERSLIVNGLKAPNDAFKNISGNYNMNVTELGYAGNEKLYEQMGASLSAQLVQVSTYNVLKGAHSEEIPLERLRVIIATVLQASDGSMSEAAATAAADLIIQKSAVGLASERSPCVGRCDPQTSIFPSRFAIADHGIATPDHKAATAIINAITARGMVLRGKEIALAKRIQDFRVIGVSEEAIREQLGLQTGSGTGAQPATQCGPQAAGQPGSGDMQGMALMAFSSGNPCGDGEGAPGAIIKALTSGNLGGVDFSTLQIRYMSDDPDSTGLLYAFSAQKDTSATPQNLDTALNVLADNAADLRTWLVLNPDQFWVNLNPSEPDRIITPQLGETNAGRELLDADLQLKRSSATLLNPNTKLGAQYWQDLAGGSSSVCYGSRMWIVPGQVQVREDGGSLYILKAQLAVDAVPDHVADMPATCHYTPQTDARGQRLDQTMIVPLITKMVNTAPVYAPIRRAFMARIVAQWIRDRHANGEHTSFDHLINSGNIGPAKLQDGWKPQQVYDTYLKSLEDGEFTYTTTIHQGGATYLQKITVGGVDFTHLNPATISAAQMNQDYPQLPQTAKSSVTQITSSSGSLWLGDTIAPATGSMRSNPGDLFRSLTSGRTGILILVLAALVVVIFGIRRGSRRGRQTA